MEQVTLTNLEGYNSRNYKVEGNNGTFVLKEYVYSAETLALLDSENRVLEALCNLQGYQFPQTVHTADGQALLVKKGCIFRLLNYVDGEFLGDITGTTSLYQSFGIFLGKMDKCLLGSYEAPLAARAIVWDLKNLVLSYKFLSYIPDPRDRSLVDYFFLQFEENVIPLQHTLRKSIIHNDSNDWNVLTDGRKVTGLIDFGDMCHSWLINELAVGITYLIMDKSDLLDIAGTVIGAYHSVLPLEKQELDLLYYLIAARLCISVCNSAYTKTLKPDSDYITVSEKGAWQLLKKWITINPVKARDEFYKAAGFEPPARQELQVQLNRRAKVLSKSLSLSYDNPIQMNRSAFQYMYDTEGNTYLDAYNNIMLAGHCHPRVVRAGQRTIARLNTNTRYMYEELVSYSEKLLARFPKPLSKVFLVNSGSAASDLAIRLATTHTGRNKIVVLEHGYHGNTRAGIEISHYKFHKPGAIGQRENIITVPLPNAFKSGYSDDGTAGSHFSSGAIREMEVHQSELAAFIAEPIVGCGGQVPLPAGYLKAVYPFIRSQGGVCISDEVQVGFGRLGDYFWGYEMQGVVPDIVIIGKPMGNGHPIGAVVTTEAIAASFESGPEFFSSFGGNPVSCAIGEAVLDVIAAEKLQEHAKKVGDHLMFLLRELKESYPVMADIRGSGLFLGVEMADLDGNPDTILASRVKNGLRKHHILISTDGPYDNVLKIKPPLAFTFADAEELVKALGVILREPA